MHVRSPKTSFASERSDESVEKARRSFKPLHRHTSKPSSSATGWADTPFRLIPTPRKSMSESGAVFVASEMASIHNMILRGLNSIMQQGPHVPDARQPGYHAQDVSDFLTYITAWCDTLEHHHNVEHSTLFPHIEQMAEVPDLMDEMEEQHEEFSLGLYYLKEYAETAIDRPYLYRWRTMNKMIMDFAPALVHHLHDEIDFLLSMNKFDCEGLRRCWLEAQKVAVQFEDDKVKYKVLPFVLGNSDRSYENGNNFPHLSTSTRCAVKLYFSGKHRGAWRFNSCDFHGRPVPLAMLPENRED